MLITGASSGIGFATSKVLADAGFSVLAGVRKPKSACSNPNIQEIALDVTRPDSISSARQQVENLVGQAGLFALVNNAGLGDAAPIEYESLESFRRVFEVNVFGTLAVTQAFLPLLRKGSGRVVNIGSVGGMVTIPFGAALCASKHAIEAISDAMRIELFSSGIFVTCIQPASINSGAAEKLVAQSMTVLAQLPAEGKLRYGAMFESFLRNVLDSESRGSPPRVVGNAVLDVLRSRRPPTRRLAGKHGHLIKFLALALPDSLRDAILRKQLLGKPRPS